MRATTCCVGSGRACAQENIACTTAPCVWLAIGLLTNTPQCKLPDKACHQEFYFLQFIPVVLPHAGTGHSKCHAGMEALMANSWLKRRNTYLLASSAIVKLCCDATRLSIIVNVHCTNTIRTINLRKHARVIRHLSAPYKATRRVTGRLLRRRRWQKAECLHSCSRCSGTVAVHCERYSQWCCLAELAHRAKLEAQQHTEQRSNNMQAVAM
jgi:hypothetical protein